MNLAAVDPIIRQWAHDNSIPFSTTYRDVEVRSFDIVLTNGERRQIWIETNGAITVSVWDYKKRRRDYFATPTDLSSQLDAALRQARAWK